MSTNIAPTAADKTVTTVQNTNYNLLHDGFRLRRRGRRPVGERADRDCADGGQAGARRRHGDGVANRHQERNRRRQRPRIRARDRRERHRLCELRLQGQRRYGRQRQRLHDDHQRDDRHRARRAHRADRDRQRAGLDRTSPGPPRSAPAAAPSPATGSRSRPTAAVGPTSSSSPPPEATATTYVHKGLSRGATRHYASPPSTSWARRTPPTATTPPPGPMINWSAISITAAIPITFILGARTFVGIFTTGSRDARLNSIELKLGHIYRTRVVVPTTPKAL